MAVRAGDTGTGAGGGVPRRERFHCATRRDSRARTPQLCERVTQGRGPPRKRKDPHRWGSSLSLAEEGGFRVPAARVRPTSGFALGPRGATGASRPLGFESPRSIPSIRKDPHCWGSSDSLAEEGGFRVPAARVRPTSGFALGPRGATGASRPLGFESPRSIPSIRKDPHCWGSSDSLAEEGGFEPP